MTKRTLLQATDPVTSRKAAIPVQCDRAGKSVFTNGVKTLTAITVVAGVVSIFVPVVIGIAVFTGLLTVIGLVMAFVSKLEFDNQYDAGSHLAEMSSSNFADRMFPNGTLFPVLKDSTEFEYTHNNMYNPDLGKLNPASPYYVSLSDD